MINVRSNNVYTLNVIYVPYDNISELYSRIYNGLKSYVFIP